MPDLKTPEGRLEAVLEDVEKMRTEWDELGSPMTMTGSKGQPVEYPLVRMIRQAEQLAYRMERRNACRAPSRSSVGCGSHR